MRIRKSVLILTVLGIVMLRGGPLFCEETQVPPVADVSQMMVQEFQRHNYKKVIQLYKDAYVGSPVPAPVFLQILYSQALADTGDLDASIRILKELLKDWIPEMDPILLHYNLGNLLFMEKRYADARSAYQKVLSLASKHGDLIAKSKEKMAAMKEGDSRRKDIWSIQMIDVETALESGEIPEGGEAILKKIVNENPSTPQAERAGRALVRIREMRTGRARALLDEARRLFDEEKKYTEVRQILEQIQRDFADVADMQSVEALLKVINQKEGKS